MTEFYVKVHPDSECFKVENGFIPDIFLESKAENGKANKELRRKLSNFLDADVGIISGAKSRRKKLKTELSEEELEQRLSSTP
jgi:uncharacterized protein YggU (UPF0235/DUF167 family)